MKDIKDTGHGISFETVSKIKIEYDERCDVLHVGPCSISPQFFEMLKESAMARECIQLGVGGENFEVVFTKIKAA